jgi:hypothetical protein
MLEKLERMGGVEVAEPQGLVGDSSGANQKRQKNVIRPPDSVAILVGKLRDDIARACDYRSPKKRRCGF